MSVADFQSAVTRLKDAGTTETRGEAREQEDSQHLWQYALAAMVYYNFEIFLVFAGLMVIMVTAAVLAGKDRPSGRV